MPLETATHITDFVTSNPAHTDGLSQADSHMRLIKSVLQTDLAGVNSPVTRVIGGSFGHLAGPGTAIAPSYSFNTNTGIGFYDAGSGVLGIAGGLSLAGLTATGAFVGVSGAFSGALSSGSFSTGGATFTGAIAGAGAISITAATATPLAFAMPRGAASQNVPGTYGASLDMAFVTFFQNNNTGTAGFARYLDIVASGAAGAQGLIRFFTSDAAGVSVLAGQFNNNNFTIAGTGTFGAISSAGAGAFSGAVSAASFSSAGTGAFGPVTASTVTASGAGAFSGAVSASGFSTAGGVAAGGAVSAGSVASTGAFSGGTGQLVPIGAVLEWYDDVLPTEGGYAWCNGQIISSANTVCPVLVARWGAKFGGNGVTTMGVPDRRDTVGVGKSTMGGVGSRGLHTLGNTVLGTLIGLANNVLTAANLPPITSTNAAQEISVTSSRYLVGTASSSALQDFNPANAIGFRAPNNTASSLQETSSGANSISVSSNGTFNNPVNNVQPSTTCNFILRIG